jgi:hypothetical protein
MIFGCIGVVAFISILYLLSGVAHWYDAYHLYHSDRVYTCLTYKQIKDFYQVNPNRWKRSFGKIYYDVSKKPPVQDWQIIGFASFKDYILFGKAEKEYEKKKNERMNNAQLEKVLETVQLDINIVQERERKRLADAIAEQEALIERILNESKNKNDQVGG